jgi:hypothetical protein
LQYVKANNSEKISAELKKFSVENVKSWRSEAQIVFFCHMLPLPLLLSRGNQKIPVALFACACLKDGRGGAKYS